MQHYLEMGRTGRVFHLSIYSTTESGIAGRAGIAGTVVTDLDDLWTIIPEQNDICPGIFAPFELE